MRELLESLPLQHKTHEKFNEAVENYANALNLNALVPDWLNTEKISIKSGHNYPSTIRDVLE